MPRPKRTKVAPSNPASRALNPIASGGREDDEAHNTKLRLSIESDAPRASERGKANHKADVASAPISSSPEVEVGRKELATERGRVMRDSSIAALGRGPRRSRQPSILGRPASRARARSSSIDSNLAESNALSVMPRRDMSSFAFGTARKRQRQRSILGRSNSRVRSSSLGLDTGSGVDAEADTSAIVAAALGEQNTRTRATRSSIDRGGDDRRNQEEPASEDDFNPEDESTPLNVMKARRLAAMPSSQLQSSATRSRKRKIASRENPPVPFEGQNDNNVESSLADLPVQEPSNAPPEPYSETMAPPASSSALTDSPSPASSPPRGRRSTRVTHVTTASRKQPPSGTLQNDPPSSPPSLTHSPNRPIRSTRGHPKAKPPPSAFSTAQLQQMLPRRRRRPANDPFDLDASDQEMDATGMASDEDELTHLTTVTNRTSRRTPAPRRITKLRSTVKVKAAPSATEKKTYSSRRRASGKENEADEDGGSEGEYDPDDSLAPVRDDLASEDSQELEARIGVELKMAKRKFEVVDQWELEFEDMTNSSSPKDAR